MKRTVLALVAAVAMTLASAQSISLLSNAAATGPGAAVGSVKPATTKTFQAVGSTTSGTGSFVINVECSITQGGWDVLGTITLSLTPSPSSNSFTSADRCTYVRGNVTTISGTGAAGTLSMGY